MLELKHTTLDVYKYSRLIIVDCYNLTDSFPLSEKFSLTLQIRRAALSVNLNIAEGASRKSTGERRRFYEISRGSLIEVDAAFETAVDLKYLALSDLDQLSTRVKICFRLLSALIVA